jgi:hypothetical protein
MADPGDRIAEISMRVSAGILLRADSQYLLTKIAELEVKLAEAQGTKPLPSGSVETTGDDK